MNKRLKKSPDDLLLAGLGALAVAEQEGNDLFQQLVEKGREVAATRHDRDEFSVKSRGFWLLKVLGKIEASPGISRENWKHSKPMDREAVAARQAKRLERAQRAILKEFGSFDKPADFERLQRERRIFTVVHRNTTYVPSFQLDEAGHPRPAVAKVIQILEGDTSDWGLALWFTAANGSLGGKRPVDLLKDDPERVVQAAEEEAEELVF
jgi:Poly(hydroxyalcanoate) granule associated protein (phasin)